MATPNFKFKNTSFNLFLTSLQKILVTIFDTLGIDPRNFEIFDMLNEEYVPESKINAKTLENKTLSEIYSFTNRYDYDSSYTNEYNLPIGGVTELSYPWGVYNNTTDFMIQVFYDGKLLIPAIDYNLDVQKLRFITTKTAHITIIRFHK